MTGTLVCRVAIHGRLDCRFHAAMTDLYLESFNNFAEWLAEIKVKKAFAPSHKTLVATL